MNMSRTVGVVASMCVVIGVWVGQAAADPSFFGYTGLIAVPSADTLQRGEWNIGLFAESTDISDENQYFFNFGVTDSLEIGLLRSRFGFPTESHNQVNIKYALPRRGDQSVRVAVGVIDATDEVETALYAVASDRYRLRRRARDESDMRRATGVNWHLGVIAGSGADSNFFAGVEVQFGRLLSLMGERFNNTTNAGVRVHLAKYVTGNFGLLNIGSGTDHRVGLSYYRRF